MTDSIHSFYRENEISLSTDFSWCEHESRARDSKKSSDTFQWKTHVELLKETITDINLNLSRDATTMAFCQPVGTAYTAAIKLLAKFRRLEALLKDLHESEKGVPKTKVARDRPKNYVR